mmetsp:Transcript_35635/g.92564  ORF Transcript_35635/g.92564 Transcript_35635/m.92564 type:complete len:209 (+) Transcript_35635:585-1211(+)
MLTKLGLSPTAKLSTCFRSSTCWSTVREVRFCPGATRCLGCRPRRRGCCSASLACSSSSLAASLAAESFALRSSCLAVESLVANRLEPAAAWLAAAADCWRDARRGDERTGGGLDAAAVEFGPPKDSLDCERRCDEAATRGLRRVGCKPPAVGACWGAGCLLGLAKHGRQRLFNSPGSSSVWAASYSAWQRWCRKLLHPCAPQRSRLG